MRHFVLLQTDGLYEGVFNSKRAAIKSYKSKFYHWPGMAIKVFEGDRCIKTIWLEKEPGTKILQTRRTESFNSFVG